MREARAAQADAESRLSRGDHDALRLWLRLFTCSTMIERGIRARLRERFGITLARFDYLAQLAREPDGLRMQALSHRLMVTGGNVTGLTRELAAEGLVERRSVEADRRVHVIRLTPRGRRAFDAMALAHERWVVDALDGLSATERRALYGDLGRLKRTLSRPRAGEETSP